MEITLPLKITLPELDRLKFTEPIEPVTKIPPDTYWIGYDSLHHRWWEQPVCNNTHLTFDLTRSEYSYMTSHFCFLLTPVKE